MSRAVEAEAAVLRAIEAGPMCWTDIAAACQGQIPACDLWPALRRLRRRGLVAVSRPRLPSRGASRIAGSGLLYGVAR